MSTCFCKGGPNCCRNLAALARAALSNATVSDWERIQQMAGEGEPSPRDPTDKCREPAGRCTNTDRCKRAGDCCWETWAAVAPSRPGAI